LLGFGGAAASLRLDIRDGGLLATASSERDMLRKPVVNVFHSPKQALCAR
jgi:hypothetical protein